MTLTEGLGAIGGILLSSLCTVAALFLGYGFMGVILAMSIGFAVGWAVGVGLTIPVMWMLDRLPAEDPPKLENKEKQKGDDLS